MISAPADFVGELPVKTRGDYAKLCADGKGACPAWRDGVYPELCACRQKNEAEHQRFVRRLIITIGCFAVVGPLGFLLALFARPGSDVAAVAFQRIGGLP